jgi:hypothetical protein
MGCITAKEPAGRFELPPHCLHRTWALVVCSPLLGGASVRSEVADVEKGAYLVAVERQGGEQIPWPGSVLDPHSEV